MDAINGRFGRGAARPAAVAAAPGWSMRRANLSPCYTTRLDDMLEVSAC
jgi:DNA polymerase V